MPRFHNIELPQDQIEALTKIEDIYGQDLLPREILSEIKACIQTEDGRVTGLSLINYRESSLPDELWNIKSLKRLYVCSGGLTELSSHLGDLKELEELMLLSNKITILPKEICTLSQLKIFLADNNKIHSLPNDIGHLGNLQILCLHWNPLEQLPDTIDGLRSLKILGILGTNLHKLPLTIGALASLECISVGGQYFKDDSFPLTFAQLPLLSNLTVHESLLEKIPSICFEPPSLKVIDFRGNSHLTSLPEAIGVASQLERMYLPNNQISTIPEAIGRLKNLQYLMLTNNPMTNLPASWSNLHSLRVLWLDNTHFRGPWPNIDNFPLLEELYLPVIVPDTAESWVHGLISRGCKIFWGSNHVPFDAKYYVTRSKSPH